MARDLTPDEKATADAMLARARTAMDDMSDYTQEQVDRLAQALGWNCGNEETFVRIAQMGVDESGIGDRAGRVGKRGKILGVLRDALRGKSVGIIEEDPEKGLTKIGKPAGVIASLIPTTNPELTPPVTGIYAIKCKDAVIFSPHPRAAKTTFEMVRVMRETLAKLGAPRDMFQCVETPSIPLTNYLMSICDLTMATGGKPMVQAAYSSGKPAYGVGAGNATMVIDADADVAEAAMNSRISKTSDFGSGCSADGNLIISENIYDEMKAALISEGGYLCNADEKALLAGALWKEDGGRRIETVAIAAQDIATFAGFTIPDDRKFIMVEQEAIGKEHKFSGEKLSVTMALYKFTNFEDAKAKVRAIYEVGGKGHSCGIYSFNEDHILQHAMNAPVSRIMVRQPQSKANAGAFNNGMPMTSSLGCGVWGGNVTNENVSLKHYMNVTWVARPIAEDRPSDAELFGEFYNTEVM
ncbi:aldehyde dehydrogenase family protein [Celeribacter marinus]|uniref:Alcohol dehydrogenase, acetaldehyde dehydrogenase n=1 Tax=Celeribacter marinus TaxID=1397108 RepID=A0A0N9ZC21_9RHOB|nr:aldehyde dehydrogenase family protein [Celeribacter marinus]ALI54214.1 Alcohol dehydrogenase, acetaldehyde dehydrogenase [Celeribacter marinus]SFK31900.1 sulfoacetaldehyde dehydrogenase [Celeribacter marinus]